MLQVLYFSSAVDALSAEDLDLLLAQAQQNNQSKNITGMLLYAEGAFFQVLEGPDDTVRALLATLEQDPRHTGMITMHERAITKRDFPDWSMGYKRTEQLSDLPSAFFDLSKSALRKKTSPDLSNEVLLLMSTFENNALRNSA